MKYNRTHIYKNKYNNAKFRSCLKVNPAVLVIDAYLGQYKVYSFDPMIPSDGICMFVYRTNLSTNVKRKILINSLFDLKKNLRASAKWVFIGTGDGFVYLVTGHYLKPCWFIINH